MNPEYLNQVQAVATMYHDLVALAATHDDSDLVTAKFDQVLTAALDAFSQEADAITVSDAAKILKKITSAPDRVQKLANDGITAFSCPITVQELQQQIPAMIPLMIVTACLSRSFHNMWVWHKNMESWRRFCNLYDHTLEKYVSARSKNLDPTG
jgi:hypothetical protein